MAATADVAQNNPVACEKSAVRPPESCQTFCKEAPECPICMCPLCDPLALKCGHAFCRLCLLRATRLAPTGRSCPLCRADVNITSPADHPMDEALDAAVRAMLPHQVYEERRKQSTEELQKFKRQVELPIFFMSPGVTVGSRITLHFFEPRYTIMIRRVWEGSQLFMYCASTPKSGLTGVVVKVLQTIFLPDMRAIMIGECVQRAQLGETWVEENTGGLYYARVDDLIDVDGRYSNELSPISSVNFSQDMAQVPPATAGCGCTIM